MAKYISFSVWGNEPLYNIGMIRNIELAKEIFPDWEIIVYYDDTVSDALKETITKESIIGINMSNSDLYGPFWRFLAADRPDCEYVIFRDADSRLSKREKEAVEEWIHQGTAIHVMRDHPYHKIPYGTTKMSILAGMWGLKGGNISMESLILLNRQHESKEYGSDQAFLQDIYDKFEQDVTVHDEFFSNRPFPSPRYDYRFVGERIGIDEQPYGEDWRVIKTYYENKKPHLRIINFLIRRFHKIFK